MSDVRSESEKYFESSQEFRRMQLFAELKDAFNGIN